MKRNTRAIKEFIAQIGLDYELQKLFVNTVCNDGTDIADLISCFTKKVVNNPKFPVLIKRMRELKEDERSVKSMCEIMEKYLNEAREEGREKGRREAREEAIKTMLEYGLTKEQILRHYSAEEYEEAVK